MPIQLDFSSAEEQRLKITQQQQAYISNLYRQAAKEVGRLAEKAPRVPSDAIRQQYLHTLQGQIEDQLKYIEGQLNSEIRSSMSSVAKATVADAKTFLKENGLPIKGAYSHVPADIVQSVASGQLYSGNWTLSKALWLHTAGTQQDVQSIVAQGIIQNKSAYDIAKDLEKYVNPDARKDWEWSKVYPGTSKVVDYNAQRLARTMVSHAYQQAFVRTTKNNPFVEKYRWEASGGERMCEICEERNGKLFDKDDFPLDHPNGMCTFTAVMDNLETIGERLGDWAAGKDDPELDKWAEDIYGKGWEDKKGEQVDTTTEIQSLLDQHTIGGTVQKQADTEIASHIANNDSIGKALEKKAAAEEQAWKEQEMQRNKQALDYYKEQLEDIKQELQPGGMLSSYTEEDLKDMNLWPQEPDIVEALFYRKGSMNGDVLAFTTNPEGAGMSFLTDEDFGHIGYDHSYTLDELNKMGYRPIAGIQKMDVGMVGESEVLFVKFPKRHR